MKTMKKLTGLLLVLTLVFSLASCGASDQTTASNTSASQEQTTIADDTPTPGTQAPDPADDSTKPGGSDTPSSDSGEDIPIEIVPDKTLNGDIMILYTSDVHCGIEDGFGYVGLAQIRDSLVAQGYDVILVDNGDNIQGGAIGTMTKGQISLDLMNDMGYSVAIPGNHEFDYGVDVFLDLAKQAEFDYISCNLTYKGELIFQPYVIHELAGHQVAFVGMTTPRTVYSSNPSRFQDDEGHVIYGFTMDETGEALYQAVQDAVDSARKDGAEYVIAMGHMGNSLTDAPYTYADVISHTSGIDMFLDGHSHDTDKVTMKNAVGESVTRVACGTKLSDIGWVKIAKDGVISTGLYHWGNTESLTQLLAIENDMSKAVKEATGALAEKLKQVVARTDVKLTINDPVAVDKNNNPIRMVRRAETNLGDLVADAYRVMGEADIGFVNGGGVRGSLEPGNITLNDIYAVQPFSNTICVIEATGQQLLDALEWSARSVPEELGSFLQVSGVSFEIHSYIPTPCIEEEKMCMGIVGERRIRNVKVNGTPLDPEATYTIASSNYILKDIANGYTMFYEAPMIREDIMLDNQMLIDYITESLGGVIGKEYEDQTGDGRIVIIDKEK